AGYLKCAGIGDVQRACVVEVETDYGCAAAVLHEQAGVVELGGAGKEVAQRRRSPQDKGAPAQVVPDGCVAEINAVGCGRGCAMVIDCSAVEHGEEAAAEGGSSVEDGAARAGHVSACPGPVIVDRHRSRSAYRPSAFGQVADDETAVDRYG